ncbi:MAG: SUMF1/EgtB/PvdO family nonheme iron enzyme [Gammaproteobacteria bacterium]|nr:SUMF1/EgtB/PvdO family nonheme iron enzyme [Gammaproteobacteria bacterium]
MSRHQLLGQLSGLQQMITQLLLSLPEEAVYHRYLPQLPSMAWLLGRGVYVESWWLRHYLPGEEDKIERVTHLFTPEAALDEALQQQLPPRDHLLNWALELQEENLLRLANPELLSLSDPGQLQPLMATILHHYAALYEDILSQMCERQRQLQTEYRVLLPLCALPPSQDHADLLAGHFRVGAKEDPLARDSELPPQIVELSSFRIDKHPVSNGAWLQFMEAGGYQQQRLWQEEGWRWLQTNSLTAPYGWQRDGSGAWYGTGINGGYDLVATDAVAGVSHYEAIAYSRWVAEQGERLSGAVVQHEYQWEVAARAGLLSRSGQVWEWCGNLFHPYTGYRAPEAMAADQFTADHYTLRGGSLHTQRIRRRLSFRDHSARGSRHRLSGLRLVFPPSQMPWH